MNKSVVFLLALTSMQASGAVAGKGEDELARFDTLCKTDADVVANGYEFKTSGLPYSIVADTIKNTFANKTGTTKESGNDALYLIDIGYRLKPELRQEVIREAAYRLCMKEKLSTDR
jgi:phage major head subunit gpT-like protein